jgi:hypothetical protein
VTATGHVAGTIQNVLNAQIDFVAQTFTGNLDAVRQRRECAVRPTAATVLGNVLIEGMRQVADAVNVTPIERGWQVFCLNVRVR